MKRFIALQICIVLIGAVLCTSFTSSQTNAGFTGIESYDELKSLNAYPAIITEEDAVLGQTAQEYAEFFYKMYESGKSDVYDMLVITAVASDQIKLYNRGIEQQIEITSVLDGDSDLVGSVTNITYLSGFYYETQEECDNRVSRSTDLGEQLTQEDYSQKLILKLAGLNVMKPGDEYLIFAQSVDMGGYTIICAEKHQFTWMDISAGQSQPISGSTLYSQCYENEIFTDSQAVIDDYYRLKEDLFDFYGIAES